MDGEVEHYPMYIGGVKQVYPNVPPGSPIYAKSVVAGNLVFVSGMTGQDVETGQVSAHDIAGQMLVALDKVKAALEETGSNMNNIIKTLMLLKNLEDYSTMRKTELEYYQKHAPLLVEQPPASTFIQVASLAKPEFLVEMEVIAVLSRGK